MSISGIPLEFMVSPIASFTYHYLALSTSRATICLRSHVSLIPFTRQSWYKGLWAFFEAWRSMVGFKVVITLSSTLSCSNRANWYFSILLAISNILLSVPNYLCPCGARSSFCASLQPLPPSGIHLYSHCPNVWTGYSHDLKRCTSTPSAAR